MIKIQKTYLFLFVLFLAIIPLWRYLVVPELLKLPGDYERSIDLHSVSSTRHDLDTDWSIATVVRAGIKEITDSVHDDNLQIIHSVFDKATLEGEQLWKVEHRYSIDRKSRVVVKKDGIAVSESYYILPQHIQQQKYTMWLTANNPSYTFSFKGVEEISGLKAYHFTTSEVEVDDTEGFSWLKLVPEIYHISSVQAVDLWIEPVSGIVINGTDVGTSYYVDRSNGEKVYAMQRWDNKFNNDTIANQVRIAQNEKQKIILYERWIPILFGLIALALLIALFASRKVALTSKS